MKLLMHSALMSALMLATVGAQAATVRTDSGVVMRPTGKGTGEIDRSPGAAQREADAAAKYRFGIIYHGGPVMTDPSGVNVYYIWYGNWSGNTATSILTDLVSGFTGSPWWNINTTYYDGARTHIVNKVNYMGSVSNNYSYGTSLSDSKILSVVTDAIGGGQLPLDANALYFVLTSADVTASSGFCTAYCGWHNKASYSGTTIKYSFVGNPDRCPTSCEIQQTGPNDNAGADGMASVIAHELAETATDPQLNAWYFPNGEENADKCAWTFGTTYKAANGSDANMKLSGRDFMIQQNWVNHRVQRQMGACAVGF